LFSDPELAQREIAPIGLGDAFVAVQFDDLDHFAAFLRTLLAFGFCAAVLDPVREEESGQYCRSSAGCGTWTEASLSVCCRAPPRQARSCSGASGLLVGSQSGMAVSAEEKVRLGRPAKQGQRLSALKP
jgi:hypothetical protein